MIIFWKFFGLTSKGPPLGCPIVDSVFAITDVQQTYTKIKETKPNLIIQCMLQKICTKLVQILNVVFVNVFSYHCYLLDWNTAPLTGFDTKPYEEFS